MVEYIPLYLDWMASTDGLSAQEKGRLVDAMVLYATGEDWQDQIKGNEKFVFNVIRGQIDRHLKKMKANKENGSLGGRPVKTDEKPPKTDGYDIETPENHINTNIETNIETNTKTNTKAEGVTVRARARFTPPTPDDVRAYCSENGYQVDAERFVAYYEANGWRVGRNPMRDWRAAVRTWIRNDAGGLFGNRPDLTRPDPRIAALEELKRKFEAEEGGS